jgi:hypothetical protein
MLENANAAASVKLEETYQDAVDNLGESEVREALLAKADHLSSIGHKVHLFYCCFPNK